MRYRKSDNVVVLSKREVSAYIENKHKPWASAVRIAVAEEMIDRGASHAVSTGGDVLDFAL